MRVSVGARADARAAGDRTHLGVGDGRVLAGELRDGLGDDGSVGGLLDGLPLGGLALALCLAALIRLLLLDGLELKLVLALLLPDLAPGRDDGDRQVAVELLDRVEERRVVVRQEDRRRLLGVGRQAGGDRPGRAPGRRRRGRDVRDGGGDRGSGGVGDRRGHGCFGGHGGGGWGRASWSAGGLAGWRGEESSRAQAGWLDEPRAEIVCRRAGPSNKLATPGRPAQTTTEAPPTSPFALAASLRRPALPSPLEPLHRRPARRSALQPGQNKGGPSHLLPLEAADERDGRRQLADVGRQDRKLAPGRVDRRAAGGSGGVRWGRQSRSRGYGESAREETHMTT